MLISFLACIAIFVSAHADPLFVSEGGYKVDKSLKGPGISYKGLESGWLELKLYASGIKPPKPLLISNFFRAHFRRLPEVANKPDRYELLVNHLEVESSNQPKENFSKELAGKPLVAFDTGKYDQDYTGESPNKATLTRIKLKKISLMKLDIQVNDNELAVAVSNASPKWTCLADLGGKEIGAKWQKKVGPNVVQDCEFAGWSMVKGKKIAIVNFAVYGTMTFRINPQATKKNVATFRREGFFYLNPETQEVMWDMWGKFTSDAEIANRDGDDYNNVHVYPESLFSASAANSPKLPSRH